MEDLPVEYTEHNLPLILLSGLISEGDGSLQAGYGHRQESGTRIVAESPHCRQDRAKSVLTKFLEWDGTQQPWNAVALPGPAGALKYRMKSSGRNYTLPPRKAAPLPQSPTNEVPPMKQISNELHSPLSPLSPGSPIFPDGVMTPLWFAKHQYKVPCLAISFFDFNYGGALEDDKIKADINAAKLALSRSGYRTRFAAVLMSDRSIVLSTEMEERFAAIRRATSSDAKTGLFFMPPMPSEGEIASFVLSMLTTLQPICVEFYRELTKHARRKKLRSSVPISPTLPMHGAAQSLLTSGWNARYEVKQAVFAEFRQEMDVAERHYTNVIEELCNAEGLFESMPSWSPRWDETRLLCDSTALRVIRCHLWNGMTTTATQYWFEYRSRLKSLIDRKGKGTHTYGWLAWETRWARIMSQLIQLAELDSMPKLKIEPPVDLSEFYAYARPDKAYQGVEGISPITLLHHPGYWNRSALNAARAWHRKALDIPDEDRVPPGQSPASSVASRAQAYDTYLVPEPHEEWAIAHKLGMVDHVQLALITEQAGNDFAHKSQLRMKDHLDLELAEDLIADQLYDRAMDVLAPLWDVSSWRGERWHGLFEQLLTTLNQCSIAVKNAEIALATGWELLSLPREPSSRGMDDDVGRTIGELALPADAKISLEHQNNDRLSPLDVKFAFDELDARAGDPLKCQLVIRNVARHGTQSLSISAITVALSSQDTIHIQASNEVVKEGTQIYDVQLSGSNGTAPLSISPMQMLVLNFTRTFSESGPVSVQYVSIKIAEAHYQIVHTFDDMSLLHSQSTYAMHRGVLIAQDTRQEDTTQLSVSPKPPKIDIQLVDRRKQYYVGERLSLNFRLVNEEAQAVSGTASYAVTQVDAGVVPSHLSSNDHNDTGIEGNINNLDASAAHAFILQVEGVQSATQLTVALTFSYTLDNPSQSALVKTFETTIPLMPLFEPKWTFGPLLHSHPWPSYFDAACQDSINSPSGIPQRWKAAFSAKSSVLDAVTVHKASLELIREPHDAIVEIKSPTEHEKETMNKNKPLERAFELITTKISSDDRKPFQLEPICRIEWSRVDDITIHTSRMPMPRLTMPSSEPRVLCTLIQGRSAGEPASLQYHLENLSTHFLTFALTMEASEDFAFMGAKYRTLSLAPFSRLCVPYSIMLHTVTATKEKGCWIWPKLQVVDSYYQKTLRTQPAGQDVKLDAQNGLGVFIKDGVVD